MGKKDRKIKMSKYTLPRYIQNIPNRYSPVPVMQMLFGNSFLVDDEKYRKLVVESALKSDLEGIRKAAET